MTKSQQALELAFADETPLKSLAEDAVRTVYMSTFPGGTRVHTPTMQGALWGRSREIVLSLLKTDVIDRRIVARKPFTVDEIVKGAFAEANRDFDDMPRRGLTRAAWGVLVEEGGRRDFEAWSQQYPFPCQKPVGQIIARFDGGPEDEALRGVQSLRTGEVTVHIAGTDEPNLKILLGMKRNVVALECTGPAAADGVSFTLFRHQDQGHRKYMDERGNFIPEKEREVVFRPADPARPFEYYDLEADAAMNGPFEPPESGSDGRFVWVAQRFPAEATFPDGFRYVMMALLSDADARVSDAQSGTGLGAIPRMRTDKTGKVVVEPGTESHWYMHEKMHKAYQLLEHAPGTAVTTRPGEGAAGKVELYVAVVTSNDTEDLFEEAKRRLLEAEAMGYSGLVEENARWYETLYDRREEGRVAIGVSGAEKERIDSEFVADAFRSWAISDGGYCDPDPRKYEGSEVYVGFDMDAQSWHSLPCYNEIFSEPMMVWNRHEPCLYYPRLVEAWYEGLRGKAQAIYGLPGIVLPHGYLAPIAPNPWYMENQALDLCLDVSGQVMKVLWNMWDYRADEEMLRSLVYPAVRDLATFFEAFARRNYDGTHYNLLPVVETENWGISYRLEHARNTTAAIAMFRKILTCAIEGAELLGQDADRVPGWRDVAEHLPPYARVTVSSGEILAGIPGEMPRYSNGDHPYLTNDFPATLADEITLDSPREDRDLIARTNDVLRGNWNTNASIVVGKFRDHTPCSLNGASVRIEDHETLVSEIIGPRELPGQKQGRMKNVVWPERPGTERLLNSRGGRIHLFPVVPDWSHVAFREFQARGGFLVSASRDAGGVSGVLVTARRSILCRVMSPWPGGRIVVTDLTADAAVAHEIDTANGECVEFAAEAGHQYSIDPA